jgi:hypothetical protein
MLPRDKHGKNKSKPKCNTTDFNQLNQLTQHMSVLNGFITVSPGDIKNVCCLCEPGDNFTTLSKVSKTCQELVFGASPFISQKKLFEKANAEKVDWPSLSLLEKFCYTNGGNITHGIKLGPGHIPDGDALWKASFSAGVVFAVVLGMWIIFLIEERLLWWLEDFYDTPR